MPFNVNENTKLNIKLKRPSINMSQSISLLINNTFKFGMFIKLIKAFKTSFCLLLLPSRAHFLSIQTFYYVQTFLSSSHASPCHSSSSSLLTAVVRSSSTHDERYLLAHKNTVQQWEW